MKTPPLTLVGSPPVIHLLQWKFNTMDPSEVSWQADKKKEEKKTAARRAGSKLKQAGVKIIRKKEQT